MKDLVEIKTAQGPSRDPATKGGLPDFRKETV